MEEASQVNEDDDVFIPCQQVQSGREASRRCLEKITWEKREKPTLAFQQLWTLNNQPSNGQSWNRQPCDPRGALAEDFIFYHRRPAALNSNIQLQHPNFLFFSTLEMQLQSAVQWQ